MPELAQRVAADHLATIDHEAPGLVKGRYLVGSMALDDSHPRTVENSPSARRNP